MAALHTQTQSYLNYRSKIDTPLRQKQNRPPIETEVKWGVYFASVSMRGLFCFCLNGGSILLLSQWGCLFCICLRFVNWSLELFWQCGVFYFSCCHDVIMLSRCYHVFPSLIILNIFLLFIATELLLVIANSCLERHLPHAWIAVCDCQ